MRQNSWGKIIAQIEQSGLDLEKRYIKQKKQRYEFLQRDLIQQMKQIKQKKLLQFNSKGLQRNHNQAAYKTSIQEELQSKQKLRQKQQKIRNQNFNLLQEKANQDLKDNIKSLAYKQSPFTSKLFNNSLQKQKKSKQMIKQYNLINANLINQKAQIRTKMKSQNDQKEQQFKNYVEQTFSKIQSDRYKFKKSCLQKGINRSQRFTSEPDSLQKQYSFYLQQQIEDKKDKNYYRNRSQVQNDDIIRDENIRKINHDLDKQSSSPAYLGRISNSYQRQKQLSYLDKQFLGNKKFYSQQSWHTQKPENQQKNQTYPIPEIGNQILTKSIEYKIKQRKPIQMRHFKQYNIVTCKQIINNQPIYFS